MSTTETSQTTIPQSRAIDAPDSSQSFSDSTSNTATPQPTRLVPLTNVAMPVSESAVEKTGMSNSIGDSAPSSNYGNNSSSTARPSILERLPKKEELLEGVIDRFKAFDLSFDVKFFKRSKDVGHKSNLPGLDVRAGDQDGAPANRTAVQGSAEVPPAIHVQSPTTEFPAEPPSYATNSMSEPSTNQTLPEDPDANDDISPTYLARKIQALLDSFPPPNEDYHPREEPCSVSSPVLSAAVTPLNSPIFTTAAALPSSPASSRHHSVLEFAPVPHSQPQVPPNAKHMADPELMQMLSSAAIMNGSDSRGKRTSVWSVLEDLRAPKGWPRRRNRPRRHQERQEDAVGSGDTTPGNSSRGGQFTEGEDEGDAFSDTSSVMMYSPLLPTTSSLVELAETEFMPMSMPVGGEDTSFSGYGGTGGATSHGGGSGSCSRETEREEDSQAPTSAHMPAPIPEPSSSSPTSVLQETEPGGSWMKAWPFSWNWMAVDSSTADKQGRANAEVLPGAEKKDKQTMTDPDLGVQPAAEPSSSANPTSAGPPPAPPAPPPDPSPENLRTPRFRVQGQRRWVPSTTKLSFEALWWGYRIYLPPPVLSVLSDRQLEATKRAALITTALTWFFSNIPMNAVPPAVRPILSLLKTLVPCVGYIGTFISWSWTTMMGYDEGYGIILTATWILPVALIPGTWNERDFPPASPGPQDPPSLPFSLGAGSSPIPGSIEDPSIHRGAASGSTFPPLPTTPGATAIVENLSTPVPYHLLTPPSSPSLWPSPIRSSPSSEMPSSPQPYPASPLSDFTTVSSPASPEPLSPPLPSAAPPPSAPSQRTIPLPEPHRDPSRFRPLPDLPEDPGSVHYPQLESLPPAPTPRTIPLPDIEDRPIGERKSRKGKGKGKERVDGKERKFWKKSPKHQSNVAGAQAVFGS